MSRTIVHTDRAPAAIGTYSQATIHGKIVFLSGQIPLDPETMETVDGNFEAQARQVFENVKAIVEAAGGTMAQVLKMNLYLTDLSNFATVNEANLIYSGM